MFIRNIVSKISFQKIFSKFFIYLKNSSLTFSLEIGLSINFSKCGCEIMPSLNKFIFSPFSSTRAVEKKKRKQKQNWLFLKFQIRMQTNEYENYIES